MLFRSCYATALEPRAGESLMGMAQQRAGLILAASCDPTTIAQLA